MPSYRLWYDNSSGEYRTQDGDTQEDILDSDEEVTRSVVGSGGYKDIDTEYVEIEQEDESVEDGDTESDEEKEYDYEQEYGGYRCNHCGDIVAETESGVKSHHAQVHMG